MREEGLLAVDFIQGARIDGRTYVLESNHRKQASGEEGRSLVWIVVKRVRRDRGGAAAEDSSIAAPNRVSHEQALQTGSLFCAAWATSSQVVRWCVIERVKDVCECDFVTSTWINHYFK